MKSTESSTPGSGPIKTINKRGSFQRLCRISVTAPPVTTAIHNCLHSLHRLMSQAFFRRPARYRCARHSEGQRRRGLMELPGQPARAPRPSPRPTSPAAARAARAPGPAAAQAAPLPAGGSPVIPRLRARQTAPPLSPAPLRAAALCP